TPTALISGADSKIRHGMFAACSASPSVNPPMPPPTIMMSSMFPSQELFADDETRLVSPLSIWPLYPYHLAPLMSAEARLRAKADAGRGRSRRLRVRGSLRALLLFRICGSGPSPRPLPASAGRGRSD